MPFHYFHSENLDALFPVLRAEMRNERHALPPQKMQAIVVGNLETEAWITRRFIAADGVLMGVCFPFLESAIHSFSERLEFQIPASQSESWFLPPTGERQAALGIAEFEILLLGILTDKRSAQLLHELGYRDDNLTASQITTLAGVLADELRETILHAPALLTKTGRENGQARTPGEKLWRELYQALRSTGHPFPAFEPALAEQIAARQMPGGLAADTLHLFGMPALSEYHLRALAAIARHLSVKLYMTDLSSVAEHTNLLLATAGKKAVAFTGLLRDACSTYGAPFTAEAVAAGPAQQKQFALYALPGIWRGAELMGDEFHEILLSNPQLYQDDVGVSLTDPGLQYAAFERSLAMRELVAFSRERFYEVSHPLAGLWQIIAEAVQSGLSRQLLARYALHPLVAEQAATQPERIAQWLRALDKAQAYRDDYPAAQEVFSIESALRRMNRGLIIQGAHDTTLPAARTLRLFDSADFAAGFYAFLQPLARARAALGSLTGEALARSMLLVQHEISAAGESTQVLAGWFDKVKMLRGFSTLGLPHMVRLLRRHLQGKSLAQQTGHEGITFSSLAASCYTRDTQLLFDLSEDADRREAHGDHLFPEIQKAPTRFTVFEQLATQVATALSSSARYVILAHSAQDPATGAAKYPSQVLAEARAAAEALGRAEVSRPAFGANLLHNEPALPAIASDADRRTAWLLQRPAAAYEPLSSYTLPPVSENRVPATIDLRDLASYLENPARHVLRRHLPPDAEIASFGHEEPRLAVSSDARLRFCEEYLDLALLDANAAALPSAAEYVRARQMRGEYAPEGFDQAGRLLAEDGNDRRLTALAQTLSAHFRLVEYIFRAGIGRTFVVDESPRLTRYYHDAICLSQSTLTGSSGLLLQNREGNLFRLQSAIYGNRNAALVELHLLSCILGAAKVAVSVPVITLADLATGTRSKDAIAALAFTPRASLALREEKTAREYLERLADQICAQRIFWYDHSMVKDPKLAEWSGMSCEEVLQRLAKPPETNANSDLQRLQKFFALEVDGASGEFFEAFIRPVAVLDQQQNYGKTPGSGARSKAGKSHRPKAGNT